MDRPGPDARLAPQRPCCCSSPPPRSRGPDRLPLARIRHHDLRDPEHRRLACPSHRVHRRRHCASGRGHVPGQIGRPKHRRSDL